METRPGRKELNMDEEKIMENGTQEEADSFMDGWEETSPAGEEPEDGTEETGGDQTGEPEPEQSGENGPQGAAGPADGEQSGGEAGGDQTGKAPVQQEQPRTWTLNHLGTPVTASEADMVTLAQKGLDYDRIRQGYDEAKPVLSLFQDFAKRAGIPVQEYLARIRAQAKQAEGMSAEEARRTVDLEDREAVVAAKEEIRRSQEMAERQELARRQAADTRMQADLREFREVFPEAAADPASIPQEVWAEVRSGRTLVAAYAKYHETKAAAEAAERAAVEEKNRQNAARAVGSMRSAGEDGGSKDPFLEGWNE